ncbi:MAG: MiaB/RimO family radical SAM methylthiotransferase [Firmicutes bacterium]|nr:MiaB/RimO family radical SAM methylthiotransferase [Bacillota bacterium]
MKIAILTLGCKTNQAESNTMAADLTARGFFTTCKLGAGETADLYIINTCAVTAMAEKKSRHMASTIVNNNPAAQIILVGCATQNNAEQFGMPNILRTFGTKKDDVVNYITQNFKPTGNKNATRHRTEHYLKIQDGCNNSCTFCIVSALRGPSTSRAIADIMTEVLSLPAKTPIAITGINLTQFPNLPELCRQIDGAGYPFRISSLYIDVIDGLFDTLATCKNFVPRFHLSLQSGSQNVLQSMGRRYGPTEIKNTVEHIRKLWPTAFISADIITGFPTETDTDHKQTVALLTELRLDHLHIFPYSPRPGTPAAEMKQIPSNIVSTRARELKNVVQ